MAIEAALIHATGSQASGIDAVAGELRCVLSQGIIATQTPVAWTDCELILSAPLLQVTDSGSTLGAIYGTPPGSPDQKPIRGHTAHQIGHRRGPLRLLDLSPSQYGRMFVIAELIESDCSPGTSLVDVGGSNAFIQVMCETFRITGPRSNTDGIDCGSSGGTVYIHTKKFYPNTDGSSPGLHVDSGCHAWIHIDEIDDGAGSVGDEVIFVEGSATVAYISGRACSLANAGDFLNLADGTVYLFGFAISTQSGSLDLNQSGGTLNVAPDVAYDRRKTSGAITPILTGLQDGIETALVTGSDATTNGHTLVDITGLTLPLAANSTYEFEAALSVNSSTTDGNEYGMALTSTSGATIEAQVLGTLLAVSPTTANMQAARLAAFGSPTQPFVMVIGDGAIRITGTITTGGTAPTLSIQHLKVTSGTATVYVGSKLTARRIK